MGIKVINNFFSAEQLAVIKGEMEDAFENKIHIINGKEKEGWTKGVDGGKVDLKIYPIHPIIDKEIYNIIKDQAESNINLKINNIGFHFCPPGAHMGWHKEGGHYTGALSIYMNEEWSVNFGGYFCYEEDGKRYLEVPEYNKAVFQKAGTMHATTPVYDKCPIRKSIQVFFE
jgi:hypothetical protein